VPSAAAQLGCRLLTDRSARAAHALYARRLLSRFYPGWFAAIDGNRSARNVVAGNNARLGQCSGMTLSSREERDGPRREGLS
jgi:hypothetical protein